MSSVKLDVTCPCCHTHLRVDQKTGEVVWQEEKHKDPSSISDMVKGYQAHRKESEGVFKKQNDLQRERARLLSEKFKEAQKGVDKTSTEKPLRDFDLD
ncbi:MAG: 2-nitropropane dioxygenase [Nitrospinaceae bacterium]